MGNKNFKLKDLYTIPNLLTYLRILLIGPFVYLFLMEEYGWAMITVGISALSDCCDGFIARRFNQITDLGKMLDPIADKLTLLAVMVCITILTPIVLPVMLILIIKDIVMLIGGSVMIKKGIQPPAAKWYGKLGTIVFYFSVILIVFLKAMYGIENPVLNIILLSVTAIFMIYALVRYFLIFRSMLKAQKNIEK